MIEFNHISKKFGHLHVLNDINLKIDEGSCVIFIGPNGCGKTTLIKCMLNMVIPDVGSVSIEGKVVNRHPRERNMVGFMPQIGHFPEHMTVNEVIRAVCSIRNYQGVTDKELFEAYHIDQLGNKKMNTLSGGTVQKVSAAIAFMFNPSIVVMDEPFAGLDMLAADILKRKIFSERQKKKTIFITSHILGDIDNIISHVVFMNDGNVKFYQSLPQLFKQTGKDNVNDAVMKIIS